MPATNEHYLSLPGDINIALTSSGELLIGDDETLLLGAYLPEVKVLSSPPKIINRLLHHVESKDKGLRRGAGTIEVRDEWRGELPADLPHLLYSLAREAWLNAGYYPTHAACVGRDNFALLPGHSGFGKTTTALTAAQVYGQKLVSGNTTLLQFDALGNIRALAGTKTMTLKTTDFEKANYHTPHSLQFGGRTAFELPGDFRHDAPVTIGRFALVRLSDGLADWTQLSRQSGLHSLYPYFLDYEAADCIVAGGRGLFTGETPLTARRALVRGLVRALEFTPVYNGIGSPEFLARKLAAA